MTIPHSLDPRQVLHLQVRRNFFSPRGQNFEYERVGAIGRSGVVYVYKHNGKRRGIKTSIAGVNLLPEYRLLEALRGGLHVNNVYAQSPEPLISLYNEIPRSNNELRWFYMDWNENGTLEEFLDDWNELFPERVIPSHILWRFFMCLARQCLEMAFYETDEPLGSTTFDTFESAEPGRLIHGDLRPKNIVLGDWFRAQSPEHLANPALKLIDFSSALQLPSAQEAIRQNILDIGIVMKLILLRKPALQNPVGPPVFAVARGVQFQAYAQIMTTLDSHFRSEGVPNLLMDLVYECTAVDPARRPDLLELLGTLREQVIRTSRNTRGSRQDENARRLIEYVVLEPEEGS